VVKKPRQLCAGSAITAGQRDAREECRPRRSDAGIRRDQVVLGGANVGAPHQQIRRQPRWQVGQQLMLVESGARWQIPRKRCAKQQHQCVLVLRRLARVLGKVGARAVDRSLSLAKIERGGDAAVVAHLGELVGALLAAKRVLGDAQQLLISEQRQISVRHLRHQADLRATTGFNVAKILLACVYAQRITESLTRCVAEK